MKKLKVQKSYALDLITYIVSGLINKYMILTFIYKIVLSSKESFGKLLGIILNRNIYTYRLSVQNHDRKKCQNKIDG